MKASEFRKLIREEIRKTLKEADTNFSMEEALIDSFMTGAEYATKILGGFDEPKLEKAAKEHVQMYIK